ncbi:penicillin-binding protein activator [uncultured Limimaricola sp.]|uniref:penicillin-binding protein activator n=1 Tax=uncultured Limimaricola sp. TaxID=2211667 RepID=UPI0030F4FAA7
MPRQPLFQSLSASAERGSRGLSRRRFLGHLAASSALLGVAGCGASGEAVVPPPGTVGRAALLAPLSGPQASIGQIMREAASLGGAVGGAQAEIDLRDAGTTDESAVAAALQAVEAGAKMLLGPLFSGQSRAVAQAVGRNVPVVSFSNDSAIAGGNLYVYGVTPLQSAKSVMGFAAARGLRRIAVVAPPGEFGTRSIAAAQAAAQGYGITLSEPVVSDGAEDLAARLSAASGGQLPDAVYLPSVRGGFEAQAAAIGAAGVQILGSDQWAAITPQRVPALQGAWFAAPDPIGFEAFAIALEERVEAEAGIVAGLAFDAIEMARLLGRLGQQTAEGLQRPAGFNGVLGPYKILPSGLVERGLAVLKVTDGATTLIGAPSV